MDGPCEKCRCNEGRWNFGREGGSPYHWLCDDCLDEEAYEAREPICEQDLEQIEFEIAEFEALEASGGATEPAAA